MRRFLKSVLSLWLAASVTSAGSALAWDNHTQITRLSLSGWDQWEEAPFEPIESVLPHLDLGGYKPESRKGFGKVLGIRFQRVNWDEQPPQPTDADSRALTIIAWSSQTPDLGMDQDLNISPDQEYMGGFTGPSSQAIRHMYYLPWDWRQPLITFHIPAPERAMGQAPERAQIFFDLAMQAKRAKHWYWAYRFLGFALHYVQDLNQPYHDQQIGSVVLLPYQKLLKGKKAFLDEATRINANFHLSFERHVEYLIDQARLGGPRANVNQRLINAFRVPQASEHLKVALEGHPEMSVREGAVLMTRAGAMLTASVIREQLALMGEKLKHPSLNLVDGFFNTDGTPKIDFDSYERTTSTGDQKKREMLVNVAAEALSNTGLATRWVFDKFRLYEK